MDFYSITAIIITLATAIAYLNHRYVKLHTTIGMLIGALLLTLLFIVFGQFGFDTLEHDLALLLAQIDFHGLVMDGMLSFLLFAGALNIDLNDLRDNKWEIATLATFGTIASTMIIGAVLWYLLNYFSIHLDFIYCLLFGALISPTDPIAVLSIFRKVGAPKNLDISVAGESLFNDGVGIVIFLTLYQLTYTDHPLMWYEVAVMFCQQALGGILYGIVIGLIGYWLIKSCKEQNLEILITLTIATGGYTLAHALGISGPLAMVAAGIFIGNHGRRFFMDAPTRRHLFTFWELFDEILNAMLFLLLGLELLIIPITSSKVIAVSIAIPLVLAARFIIVAIPMTFFKMQRRYAPYTICIMTWGGLRGGLAVALALALPASNERSLILAMTYGVVVFAIVVQGLTIAPLARKSLQEN